MQFIIPVIFSVLLVSGIRSEADSLNGHGKEGHYDYLQSFHHGGQHHPSVGGGSDVGSSGGSSSGVGHPAVGVNSQIQDQNTAVAPDQVAHQTVGQVGGHQGQIPYGHAVVSPFVSSPFVSNGGDIPYYFGRAISRAPSVVPSYPAGYPFRYEKRYASPYYAPYQAAASPYSGYYQSSSYPHHYSASPYSAAVTPYSSAGYSPAAYFGGQAGGYPGYSGYSGYPGVEGYVQPSPSSYYPGYTPYYQQSSEVQQSPSKQ